MQYPLWACATFTDSSVVMFQKCNCKPSQKERTNQETEYRGRMPKLDKRAGKESYDSEMWRL